MRIVEASIAILIIIGVVLVVVVKRSPSQEADVSAIIPSLLEEISKNISLREDIVRDSVVGEERVLSFLEVRIKNPALGYSARVCGSDEICGLKSYPKEAREIYSSERIISSTLQSYAPKKVKIFLWNK